MAVTPLAREVSQSGCTTAGGGAGGGGGNGGNGGAGGGFGLGGGPGGTGPGFGVHGALCQSQTGDAASAPEAMSEYIQQPTGPLEQAVNPTQPPAPCWWSWCAAVQAAKHGASELLLLLARSRGWTAKRSG